MRDIAETLLAFALVVTATVVCATGLLLLQRGAVELLLWAGIWPFDLMPMLATFGISLFLLMILLAVAMECCRRFPDFWE